MIATRLTRAFAEISTTADGRAVRVCRRCVMDETDPDIAFDLEGRCNHCRIATMMLRRRPDTEARRAALAALVERIRRDGRGLDYDCVIGVSGGTDSTYLACLVKELGLRPIAVHLDNGWDSELAVANIEKLVRTLDIDLTTVVLDWEAFRDLQLAFLEASTPDAEIPTDHAIVASMYLTAERFGVRWILTGLNTQTESILPRRWSTGHLDWRYIRGVWERFGRAAPGSFPHLGLEDLLRLRVKTKSVFILDYLDYDKRASIALLRDRLGWTPYEGKHHESIYTRFFQAYILPRKFDIDKRKAHLSNLICLGQVTREAALAELRRPPAPEDDVLADRDYVVKKLAIDEQQFERIMRLPVRSYRDYPNNVALLELLPWPGRVLRKLRLLPRLPGG